MNAGHFPSPSKSGCAPLIWRGSRKSSILSGYVLIRKRERNDRSTHADMVDLAEKIKKKLKDEIAVLEHELHNDLPKEISVARAHGDLSENAEYKYAKERQAYVSARLGQLHKRMADLSMLNLSNLPKDRAAYGSRITVLDVAKSTKIEYKLVTVEEADVANGLISTSSPIGRALLGKKVGDEVTVTTPAGVTALPRELSKFSVPPLTVVAPA